MIAPRGDYDGITFLVRDPTAKLQLSLTGQDFSTFAASRGFVRFSKADAAVHQITVVPDQIPPDGQTHRIGPSDTVTLLRGDPPTAGLEFTYTDRGPMNRENYYYARITQIDGEMAWSSPIWVAYAGDESE